MNARVKPAAFMPMFATSTTEGPTNPEALIVQMRAAGMQAGAWMVEEMAHKIHEFERVDVDIDTLYLIKGSAKEMQYDAADLAKRLGHLTERLTEALDSGELDAAAETAEILTGMAQKQAEAAEAIYDLIDD